MTGVAARAATVLFVCVRNGGKSQMAAGLMRRAAPEAAVHSAGTDPGPGLNALSAQVLDGVGIAITGEAPTAIDPELLRSVDLVIALGREAPRRGSRWCRGAELGHRRAVRARHRRDRAHALGPR